MVRQIKGRDGVAYIYTVESYRDDKGRPRQRTVASHGRLDVLLAKDPDALDKLKQQAKQLTAKREAQRGTIGFDTAAPWDGKRAQGIGWWLADAVLSHLGVKTVLAGGGPTAWPVLRLLVGARVVDPASKRATCARADRLMGAPDVPLRRVYEQLDQIAEASMRLQQAAWSSRGADTSVLDCVDYDVTNYFFHIDRDDPGVHDADQPRGRASRRRGHCKEGRPDPIIQMGLFLDASGLPVCFRLFDGNTPDTSTMVPAVKEFKQNFPVKRVVLVADKAMASKTNRGQLFSGADGWIVSTTARGAGKTIRAWLLDDKDWVWNPDHTSKTKSMLLTGSVPVTEWPVAGLPKKVEERIVAHWSVDGAARDAADRAEALAKAKVLADDPARYKASGRRGVKKYIVEETVVKTTGEALAPSQVAPLLSLDETKVAHEAEMDGYQMVRTSETHLSDSQVLDRYSQLWRIEQTFRVSKTDLEARPVFVRTPAHVEAHFTICFLALLVTRLLEAWTRLPAGRLIDAMRQMTVIDCGQGVHRMQRTKDWEIIDQVTGVPLDQSWATIEQLRAWRRHLNPAGQQACSTTFQKP